MAMKTNAVANEMAKLQYRMRDTFDALRLATADNRWADVAKYAAELQTFAADHYAAYGSVYVVEATSSACH